MLVNCAQYTAYILVICNTSTRTTYIAAAHYQHCTVLVMHLHQRGQRVDAGISATTKVVNVPTYVATLRTYVRYEYNLYSSYSYKEGNNNSPAIITDDQRGKPRVALTQRLCSAQ